MIPYGHQNIDEADIRAVVEILRSEWLTQGPTVVRFEQTVAAYCGAGHAVAFNSATSALHSACRALGLEAGDILWTSPNTFVASANCALYCGATVDFVDINPRTYNMSVDALREKLILAERAGRLPKIVVPVHFAGQSCEMREIKALADQYGFSIIEDASHAIGGKYLGQPVGNCRYADITVFSFHPVKIITTGEGGMALTNVPELAQRMQRLRSHGITRDPRLMETEVDGDWHYQQIELGFNFRMTDIQAALGVSQMTRIDEFVHRRRQIADRYNQVLADLPLDLPWQHPDANSAWHLYVVALKEAGGRRQAYDALRAHGIGVNVHYIPVHTQPHYRAMGFRPGDFPEAEGYYARAVSIPIYPGLSEAEQDFVVEKLKQVLQ